MNTKNEIKLLREFLKIIDDPAASERKFIRLTKIAMVIGFLLLLFCLSDNLEIPGQETLLVLSAFIAGIFFGLSLWFLQAGTQTSVMVKHMSRESVSQRIDELDAAAPP